MAGAYRAYVEILEEPVAKGFRFRYECEGRSAGSILGSNSSRDCKTFPKIKVQNANDSPSIVVVSCVTKDDPPRPHPHNLVGKDCQKGVCTVRLNNTDTTTFPNLGIQCCRKKDIPKALQERRDIRVDPFATGFDHDVNTFDLSVVRLCFQVFLKDDQGKFTRIGTPAVSQCIYDRKSKLDLGISRISRQAGCVTGEEEVILLCEKVSKHDIEVVFSESSPEGVVWEAKGDFGPQDVHRQYAIVFRTPQYRDRSIVSPVNINMFLRRPSDGEISEPLEFQYTPENRDPEGVEAKRRKKRLYQDITPALQHQNHMFIMQHVESAALSRDALRDKLMAKQEQQGKVEHQHWRSPAGYNFPRWQNPNLSLPSHSAGIYSPSVDSVPMPPNFPRPMGLHSQLGVPQQLMGDNNSGMSGMGGSGIPGFMPLPVKEEDMTLNSCNLQSGTMDSEQIRAMLAGDNFELDQLLTDLGDMSDITVQPELGDVMDPNASQAMNMCQAGGMGQAPNMDNGMPGYGNG